MDEMGVFYEAEHWPHGLMCARCPRVFREGERYTTLLDSFSEDIPVAEVVCLDCAGVTAREPAQLPRTS